MPFSVHSRFKITGFPFFGSALVNFDEKGVVSNPKDEKGFLVPKNFSNISLAFLL